MFGFDVTIRVTDGRTEGGEGRCSIGGGFELEGSIRNTDRLPSGFRGPAVWQSRPRAGARRLHWRRRRSWAMTLNPRQFFRNPRVDASPPQEGIPSGRLCSDTLRNDVTALRRLSDSGYIVSDRRTASRQIEKGVISSTNGFLPSSKCRTTPRPRPRAMGRTSCVISTNGAPINWKTRSYVRAVEVDGILDASGQRQQVAVPGGSAGAWLCGR